MTCAKAEWDPVLEEIDEIISVTPHTVHQRPEWYRAYMDAYGAEGKAHFLRVADGATGKLYGILPIQVQPVRGTRFWGLRKLVPLAHGPSDFVSLLISSGCEREFGAGVAEWLTEHRDSWDHLYLDIMPSSCGWKALVEELTDAGLRPDVDLSRGFFQVDTTRDWERYFEEYLRPRNRDLLKSMRRVERAGMRTHVVSVRKGIQSYLPEIMPIYAQRRDSLGQVNRYETDARRHFLTSVLEQYERTESVELSMLTDAEENVWAYQLDWLHQGIRYHWQHAYNEEYARYSPGKLLLFELMKQSFAEPDIVACNYMRGESEYKSRLADGREPYAYLEVVNPWSRRLKATAAASSLARIRDRVLQRESIA